MFINMQSALIFIFFKLTIFSLLVIQLYKVSKQYLIPVLQEQIKIMLQSWKNLKQKISLLTKTQKRIQGEIEYQSKEMEVLEKKLQQWYIAYKKRNEQLYNQELEQIKKLQEKKKQQYQALYLLKAEQEILPSAIAHTRAKCKEMYSGQKGKQQLGAIIKQLHVR